MATFGQICLWFILSPESSYHGEILQYSPSSSITTHSWAIALSGDYLMGLALGCSTATLSLHCSQRLSCFSWVLEPDSCHFQTQGNGVSS